MAEGEIEYESDPEEANLSLKMRRREASDDEEEVSGGGGDRRAKPPLRIDDSDGESEGAVAEYDDELEEEDEEECDLDEEYVDEEIEEVDYDESGGVEVSAVEKVESGKKGEVLVEEKKELDNEAGDVDDEYSSVVEGQQEEERKDIEPFAVPTAGAFYMHDDRFRENAGGRNRLTLGGRKLWESKDDMKWGHDKFEELTLHARNYEDRKRSSRGYNRGRGRNRGKDRISAQGNRPSNNNIQINNNQSIAPKSVRGRGPRRYQQFFKKTNEAHVTQNKQSGKSVEKHVYVSSGRTTKPVSNAKSDVAQPKKQVASSLNIASPPFYPTGCSTKDNTVPLKRDVQAGAIRRNGQQSVVDTNFIMAQSTTTIQGRNIVGSTGMENLYIDDLPSGKLANSNNIGQTQLRGQGRGLTSSTQMDYRPAVSKNQFNRGPPSQIHSVQRNPGQIHGQSSSQQGMQRLPGGPQALSPPKADRDVITFESGEVESALESKTAVVTKGKGSVQGSGKGAFLYGGAQVMGASGNICSGHGDQNFPAFLPVMQFGGHHPRGIGVPAVGMAFPGYVAQPQFGQGSSEMTWLPVLAGAAGALGASYCPPYITMDGSYNARPSGQASSIGKENNAAKIGDDGKPAQRPELANMRRQKNPRRYTEMKFDQEISR